MFRKVKLYGQLAEFVGHKEFEVKVDNVSQAVSFLIHNFAGLEAYMSPKYYQVKVGNDEIGADELGYPVGQQDIHFIPVISGAGRGFGKILLGALLITGAVMAGGGFGALKVFGGEGLVFEGDVIHHLTDRLSCREPYSEWLLKCTGKRYRYAS